MIKNVVRYFGQDHLPETKERILISYKYKKINVDKRIEIQKDKQNSKLPKDRKR